MFIVMLSPRHCGGYANSVSNCLHLLSVQKCRCGGHSTQVISCFTHLSLDKATSFTSETYAPPPHTHKQTHPITPKPILLPPIPIFLRLSHPRPKSNFYAPLLWPHPPQFVPFYGGFFVLCSRSFKLVMSVYFFGVAFFFSCARCYGEFRHYGPLLKTNKLLQICDTVEFV